MHRGQHGRVQDANDQELAVRGDPVENGMLADERAKVRRDLNKRRGCCIIRLVRVSAPQNCLSERSGRYRAR